MVIRNDFLYYLIDNVKFNHIVNGLNDNYLLGLIDDFNNASYKDIFKFNNNLDLKQVKFSLDCFFNHVNLNHYDYDLRHGIFKWKVDNNIIIGYGIESDYDKLINKEYLKEWKDFGYAYYNI